MSAAVIICAAGSSSRFGGKTKKVFEKVGGKPVFLRSIDVFSQMDDVKQIILAIAAEDEDKVQLNWEANLAFNGVELCRGGDCRGQTVQNALRKVADDIDVVAIHDAARCCVRREWVAEALRLCEESGAAALAAPVVSTIKSVDGGEIAGTIDRSKLYEAQTPQVFSREIIEKAYNSLEEDGKLAEITDDCSAVERVGGKIRIVQADRTNIKITERVDLTIAEAIIKSREKTVSRQIHPFQDEKWQL